MSGLQLIATGGAIPGRTVTNEDLSRMVDTSDEWITSRTGIRTRHWCTEDESAATLAISAAKQALARSGLALHRSGAASVPPLSAPRRDPRCSPVRCRRRWAFPRTGLRWMSTRPVPASSTA